MTAITLADLSRCLEGAVPSVIATASASGTPNVTYLSKVRMVDNERIALSNQFLSKTVQNLAENPRASLLVIDPASYDQYRLSVVYERTERRGPVFEQLRADVEAIALFSGMEGVFKLRAADIYRVIEIEKTTSTGPDAPIVPARTPTTAELAELTARLSRCGDLDSLVGATVRGLAEIFGYEQSILMLVDETERRLFTIASHGYAAEGVGSEVVIGEGLLGMAAARCAPMRIGNARQMAKYSRTVRRSYEEQGIAPGRQIPVPAMPDGSSRLAVPAIAMGPLVGVLMVESNEPVAFTAEDEATLAVIASVLGNAIEAERARVTTEDADATPSAETPNVDGAPRINVRFFTVDGSTFLDGDYLVKGVAGRLLWALLQHYVDGGRTEFTNRELRLDPSLELPPIKDNFESRLVLLKRRLDEQGAPIRIEKTGRGRFRLVVDAHPVLDSR